MRPTQVENPEPLEEPQANSTILELPEGPVEPTGDTGPSAVEKREALRVKRKLKRQRQKLTRRLAKLTTEPNRQGDQGNEASGSRPKEAEPNKQQTPGPALTSAAKRGRSSPGEKSEAKRARKDGAQHGVPTFLEAARKGIVLTIAPMDSDENPVRATVGDRLKITKVIEDFIADSSPNIDIMAFSLRGESMKMTCADQKTMEIAKRVVGSISDPRANVMGYQCLGPGDRPPRKIYGVWVEHPVPQIDQFLKLLRDKNNWFNPKKLVVKATIPKERGTTFLIGVEPEIKTELGKRNFKLSYGAGRTAVFREKSKGQPKGGV